MPAGRPGRRAVVTVQQVMDDREFGTGCPSSGPSRRPPDTDRPPRTGQTPAPHGHQQPSVHGAMPLSKVPVHQRRRVSSLPSPRLLGRPRREPASSRCTCQSRDGAIEGCRASPRHTPYQNGTHDRSPAPRGDHPAVARTARLGVPERKSAARGTGSVRITQKLAVLATIPLIAMLAFAVSVRKWLAQRVAGAGQHHGLPGPQRGGGLVDQAGLADPGLSLYQDHRGWASYCGEQQAKFPLAADEGETSAMGHRVAVEHPCHTATVLSRWEQVQDAHPPSARPVLLRALSSLGCSAPIGGSRWLEGHAWPFPTPVPGQPEARGDRSCRSDRREVNTFMPRCS